jgi:hypothetical protein
MDNHDKVEGYLLHCGLAYDTVEPGLWILHNDMDHVDNIVVQHAPPIIVFRVKLMDAPSDPAARAALFGELLTLNASEMVCGAYGLEGDAIIATETLQSQNLDDNEFQAALEGLTLGITEHYERLKVYHQAGASNDASND